ncbi:MAG TPA: OmpH family outer membrane protein [Candidatus Acidoferrales bacterium]|nr:OmpH family outer membrane protein [Candidatus Acidoferrales bacterium]
MKSVIVTVFLCLLVSRAWGQDGRIKIGYIDLQRAINESEAGKKAKERFEAEVKRAEGELLREKQEVERLKTELDKKGPLLRDEERGNLERELERKYVGYQRSIRDSQEELRRRQGELTSQIVKDLQAVVVEVGKSEKFTLILERSQLLYSDQGIDITPRVVEIYNGRTAAKASKGK